MRTQKFKLGDKFYRISGGGLSSYYKIEVDTVRSIQETDRGFTYNDRMSDFYMYTDLEKVKKQAKILIKEWTTQSNKIIDEYNKSLDGF
jgi:hypothetical protein